MGVGEMHLGWEAIRAFDGARARRSDRDSLRLGLQHPLTIRGRSYIGGHSGDGSGNAMAHLYLDLDETTIRGGRLSRAVDELVERVIPQISRPDDSSDQPSSCEIVGAGRGVAD